MRECGPCSMCCTVLGVVSIDTPCWTRCQHQDEGCAIYAEKPVSCSDYQCSWLRGELRDDERPDLIGVIVDDGLSPLFRPAWGSEARVVREGWQDASLGPDADAMAQRLVDEGRPTFLKLWGGGSYPLGGIQPGQLARVMGDINAN